jgi:cytidylate kinase
MDGPSGTGKSTVAQRLADALGARYLDTGAMYRAATLAVLRSGQDPDEPAGVERIVAAAVIELSTDPRQPSVRLDGEPVDDEIRRQPVTAAVSAVSAVPAVRAHLVAQQREFIGAALARGVGIVVEGRDIGSTVWPQAERRVYLTAAPHVRARRRAGPAASTAEIEAVAADIARRDGLDSSRAASPLRRADGAIEVDTSELDIDAVVVRLTDIVRGGVDV